MTNNYYKEFSQEAYNAYSFKKDLAYIRPVLVLCIFLYGIFGVMDYLYYPEHIKIFLTVRFAIIIPFFVIVIALSFHKVFATLYQYILLAIFVISAFGILLMIFTIGENNFYYGGLYLVFSVAFFLLRLKPPYAIVGTIMIITSFVIMGIIFQQIAINEIIAQSVFYSGFAIIGIIGSNYHEHYRLNQYQQESLMIGEKIILEKQIYEQYESIKNYHSATIFAIARLAEARDDFTGGHINRVGKLSYLLAKNIPAEVYISNQIDKKEFLQTIELASILHDIGKIAISDTILNKPGSLTESEFNIIKTHTSIGYETLRSIQQDYKDNTFISIGMQISKSHHERWDGSGYPEGLSKDAIPLAARVVSIIDVYDALISKRPYKPPYSKSKSIKIIEDGLGTQFDPIIGSVFIKIAKYSSLSVLFGENDSN